MLGSALQQDERGFFARTWAQEEFQVRGLDTRVAQCSVSYNRLRGTIRGMHYQIAPYEETKVVRCTRGQVFDVVVDLRGDSPTYRRWHGVTLSADAYNALYVPVGCAHGFQTLTDGAEVFYQISVQFAPAAARGFRYDDPAIGIVWPLPVSIISDRDRTYPDLVAT